MDTAGSRAITHDDVAPIAVLEANWRSATPVQRVEMLGGEGGSPLASAIAGRPAFIAIGPTTHRLYGDRVRAWVNDLPAGAARICVVPAGEPRKTLTTVEWLVAQVHAARLPRDGVIVGIGGGVLLDIVGLAASLYRRGVPHIKVGTTLVAQVDAAVGLKCGVNSNDSKNLVGAFYPPELVLTDGGFLRTLDARDVRCGIAEMIKLAVVCDARLFDALSADGALFHHAETRNDPGSRAIVDRAIAGMIGQLNANPYEGLLQRPVDYGHTVSGVVEIATRHELSHGEAVALDMALFAAVAARMGFLDVSELEAIIALLQKSGLDVWHPVMADQHVLQRGLTASAAHRGSKLNLPLPVGIGRCTFIEDELQVPLRLLAEAAETCREHYSRRNRESLSRM